MTTTTVVFFSLSYHFPQQRLELLQYLHQKNKKELLQYITILQYNTIQQLYYVTTPSYLSHSLCISSFLPQTKQNQTEREKKSHFPFFFFFFFSPVSTFSIFQHRSIMAHHSTTTTTTKLFLKKLLLKAQGATEQEPKKGVSGMYSDTVHHSTQLWLEMEG